MSIAFALLLSYFPEIRDGEQERLPENPPHNYDGDDYDESNLDIGLL